MECQFFRMLVSCACKFQINPWQPFFYTVNVVHHNSLWVDLKYIFKFGKHRYIDDMVNSFSKFNRSLFTSVLAALFHVNKMKHSHVAYRHVRVYHDELSFSLSVTECREGIECKGGSRGGALGARAPPSVPKKKRFS